MEAEAANAQQPDAKVPAAGDASPAALVLPAAALAGCAALAAEMLWIRGLGRGIGTTHEAMATVAGLFLAGLGLGSAFGAGRAARSERPAMTAALAFLGAGIWTALAPVYLAGVPSLHDAYLGAFGIAGDGGAAAALLLALPLVLPAAFLFGLAFPFLVRARVLDVRHTGSQAGWIYAFNTLGSVAGVIGTLLLLPEVGESMALRSAGAAALAAALLLLLAARPLPHGSHPPEGAALGASSAAGGEGIALCVSGAAALTAQMAWFRMLQPLAGAHLWGVALLLAPLLLALAVGAGLGGWLADRVRRSEALLPLLLVGAGILTLLSLPLAGGAPLWLVRDDPGAGGGRVGALILAFLFTTGPATFFFGAALPAAVRVRADATGRAAGAAGRIYGWNALGAVVGSLLAGYLLLPWIGAERALVIAGALPIVAAALLRWRIPGKRRALAAALHLLPLAVLLWPGLLDRLLSSAPGIPAVIAARKPLPPGCTPQDRADLDLYSIWFAGTRAARPGDGARTPLPAFEGRAGRVTLIEEPDGTVGLRRGALRESRFDPDLPEQPSATEVALGLLPMLMHADPKTALVIGHGAGWTAEAVLHAGPHSLDVAELDPAVLDAARAYRGLTELPVEAAAGATLCTCDGRVLLRRAARRAAGRRYDVVVSQPSHPWNPASGHLFTEEAFAAGKAALNPGGVLAQWLNLFDMTEALLKSTLASFRAVFSEVWVFRFPGELVMLGFADKPHVDVARWEAAFAKDAPGAAAARGAGYVNAGSLWRHFALDTAGLDRVLGTGTESLHDDVPRLELALAWRRVTGAPPVNAEVLLLAGFPPDMRAALPAGPARERWLTEATVAWLDAGRKEEADLWSRLLRWGATPDAKAAQARSALAAGRPVRAATLLWAALATAPERGDLAAQWLGTLEQLSLKGGPEFEARTREAAALVERFHEDGRVLAAAARLARAQGQVGDAQILFGMAVEAKGAPAPDGARAQLARLLLSQEHGPAQEARARELLASDPAVYEDIALLDLLLRLTSQAGAETEADALEGTLRTLQQTQGLAALRGAAGHLSRHEFLEAVRASRHCTGIWSWSATAFELDGLITLAALAANHAGRPSAVVLLEEALASFKSAMTRSDDPDAVRARVGRMMAWFGHDPQLLDPKRPEPDAGGRKGEEPR